MIVKILPHRPAGTGRPLGTYLLAAKHEHKGERLGPYIPDPAKDKVSWSRTMHSGVDDPMQAIGAIERYNAQNTRWHRVSRWEHIVVAFTEGERATRKQLEVIEDRLMAAIGFGDHPRISVGHHDSDHFHMHIAASRIDPTTLKAEHPRGNYFKLQAEAARLEIELGLRQERKTLLARERREIDVRAAIDREQYTPFRLADRLEQEMQGYFDALGRRGAEEAHAAGASKETIMSGLVGLARVRAVGALWEPAEKGPGTTVAFVTPVRLQPGNAPYDVESTDPARAVRDGEIIDIVAWNPAQPDRWILRTGEAVALGAVHSAERAADLVERPSPLEWLRHGGQGVVILAPDHPAARRLRERSEARVVLDNSHQQGGEMFEDLQAALRVAWNQRSISAGIDDFQHSKFARDQAEEHYNAEQREINQARLDHPRPNDYIERRAELRDSGMDPDQIDRTIKRERTQERGAQSMPPDNLSTLRQLQRVTHAFAHDRVDARALPPTPRQPHQRATPGQALYARYKTERAIAAGARKEAEQAVYDRFAGYQQGLRSFYDLRREQEKLNARQPHRVLRQNAHELLRAQQQGDRVEANKLRAIQLAVARREHPLPTWESFLERESQRGDKEAARIIRQRARERRHGHER